MMRRHQLVVITAIAVLVSSGAFWRVSSLATEYEVGHPGVFLDAGHGGPGACKWGAPTYTCTNGDDKGCYGPNGLTEAWVNHAIVPLAEYELEAADIAVKCTKDDCTEESITQRIDGDDRAIIANTLTSIDVLVSVHHQDVGCHDTEVFYSYKVNDPSPETTWKYKLALALGNGINRRFAYGRLIKDDRYTHFGSIAILQYAAMPAALIEGSDIGFAEEEDLMANNYWHRLDEALGIYDGFFAYTDTLTRPENFDCFCYTNADHEKIVYFYWDAVEGADG